MKLTRSTEYALLAAGYVARHMPVGAVVAKRIADEYAIPQGYLLKVLQQLVRSQVLLSVRGPQGGFVLARPAEEITVLDIVEAIEGAFITDNGELLHKNGVMFTSLLETLRQANQNAAHILRRCTLASLMDTHGQTVSRPIPSATTRTPLATSV